MLKRKEYFEKIKTRLPLALVRDRIAIRHELDRLQKIRFKKSEVDKTLKRLNQLEKKLIASKKKKNSAAITCLK